MEHTKDNLWVYIGGLIATIVLLTIVFKSTHEKAIPSAAYRETAKQVEAQIARQHQNKQFQFRHEIVGATISPYSPRSIIRDMFQEWNWR